jgi:hypothetical protein
MDDPLYTCQAQSAVAWELVVCRLSNPYCKETFLAEQEARPCLEKGRKRQQAHRGFGQDILTALLPCESSKFSLVPDPPRNRSFGKE